MRRRQNVASNYCDWQGRLLRVIGTAATALVVLAINGNASAGEPKEQKRELLAEHETVAQFDGLQFQRCKGLTALCPDRCGGTGHFASFSIQGYLAYKKPGEYGDPKQERFAFQVDDNMKNAKVSVELRDAVNALKQGDYVLLNWRHDYVTQNGSSGPERPVTKLDKISKEQARKYLDGAEKPPGKPPGKETDKAPAPGPR